jgi:hypothetical protein
MGTLFVLLACTVEVDKKSAHFHCNPSPSNERFPDISVPFDELDLYMLHCCASLTCNTSSITASTRHNTPQQCGAEGERLPLAREGCRVVGGEQVHAQAQRQQQLTGDTKDINKNLLEKKEK